MTKRWRNDGRIDTSGRKDLRQSAKQKADKQEIEFVKQHFEACGYGTIDNVTAAAQENLRSVFREVKRFIKTGKV